MTTLTGTIIGKYEIQDKLGRGGMAEVYKAYQKNLDRFVAIKLMHTFLVSEQDFLNRFQREAKAMAALNHPNIVSIFDFDVYGENSYYLVMEYINGGTLKDKLELLARHGQRLAMAEAIRIAREVADALAYAHKRNMVHRDIKPANIMMDAESGRAILTDFGIVKLVGGQSMAYTATGALIGTPAYMSPEQALGQSGDERVDIYSLGVLLFHMLTGQLPFEADTPLAVVMKHVNEPTPLPISFNPEISTGLQTIILKAMAKMPEERYQSADELAGALRGWELSGSQTTVQGPGATPVDIEPQDTAVSTRTVSGQTAVIQPTMVSSQPVSQATAVTDTKHSPWLYIGIVLLLAAITAGTIFGLSQISRNDEPVTPIAVLEPEFSAVPASATIRPTKTVVPSRTPDAAGTAAAASSQTKTAKPSVTAVPTITPAPTKTATPDATLEFLANCEKRVELILAYTYQSQNSSYAPVGATFPMHWILKNTGSCPWPADSEWVYLEGADLEGEETVSLESEVLADEEVTLTANLTAPNNVNTYETTWQLFNANGKPIGDPINFTVTTYIPATATPLPTNTPEVVASPTPDEVVELNYAFEIQNCEYVGSDWRCRVRLTPYGGGGGPYTMFIFLNPIVELRGQFSYDYFVQARRCAAWNTEIKVIDEATGLEMSRHLYVPPDDYIPGGCTLP